MCEMGLGVGVLKIVGFDGFGVGALLPIAWCNSRSMEVEGS